MKNLLIAIVAAMAVTGCAVDVGREFNADQVSRIQKGVTTKEDVRRMLGEPQSITLGSEGDNWTYQHLKGKNMIQLYGELFRGSLSNESSVLIVNFNGNVVKDYAFTETR